MTTDKKQLLENATKNLKKYPLIEEHFREVVINQVESSKSFMELLEIPLLRYAAIDSPNLSGLENFIAERNFTNIKEPLSRLKTNFDIEYLSVIAELNVAKLLKEEGMNDISFISGEGNPDIEYTEDGIKRFAEVKKLDDIDPGFSILHNKFHVQSIVDESFQKNIYIQCDYILSDFSSVKDFYKRMKHATDQLIVDLGPLIKTNDIKHHIQTIDRFTFKIDVKRGNIGFLFMYGGGVTMFNTAKDAFLDLSSVYSRYINSSKDAIKQLLRKRDGDKNMVQYDRVYFFLNTGGYARVIPDEMRIIFSRLSEAIGINEIVTLKIEL